MAEQQQQEFSGNAAQDPRRLTGEGIGLTVWDKYPRGRNHPNQPESDEDFKDWMITAPNSMVEEQAFAIGATIDDTVTPANPSPPTNIQYWGETPPNTTEMVDAFTPEQDTYIAEDDPRRSEEPEETKEQEEARRARVRDFEGKREEAEGKEAEGAVPRLVQEDQTKFAPNLGGMAHEAAGTEEVQNMEYDAPGEDAPVQVPIAVSAGVVDYTRYPNATHPSNEDPQPTEPPPGGGTDGGGGTPEPAPIDLVSITPETAIAGTGTFVLTVNGTGFDPACVILFKDAPVATTFVSETELRADAVPVSAAPETVDVEVQSGENLSDVLTFDFTAAGREGEEEGRRKSQRKPSKKQKGARGGKGKADNKKKGSRR